MQVNIEMKEYELVRKAARERICLTDFEDAIIDAYARVCPSVTVQVYPNYYTVRGYITNSRLRQAGRLIARNSGLGSYCRRYGNSTQLFRRRKNAGSKYIL